MNLTLRSVPAGGPSQIVVVVAVVISEFCASGMTADVACVRSTYETWTAIVDTELPVTRSSAQEVVGRFSIGGYPITLPDEADVDVKSSYGPLRT